MFSFTNISLLTWYESIIIENILLILLLILTVFFTFSKKIFDSIVIIIIYSIIICVLYAVLNAPDVAMTEAAIGVCVTSILSVLSVLAVGNDSNRIRIKYSKLTLTVFLLASFLICYFVNLMPEYGNILNLSNSSASEYYIANIAKDFSIESMPAAILASYRGYDTMVETLVILTSGLCVNLLLFNSDKTHFNNAMTVSEDMYKYSAVILLPIIIIFGLYIQFHGEISPGGGFQAGAIIASSFVLYSFSHYDQMIKGKRLLSLKMLVFLSILGYLIYALVGCVSFIKNKNYLDYSVLSSNLQLARKTGIFLVELGVGITVFAVLALIYKLFLLRAESDVDPN